MKLGCVAKVMIISTSVSVYNEITYYKLAVVGTDGAADNMDCTEEVFSKVSAPTFKKPALYDVDLEYSAGSSTKGRYQFIKVVGIGNEVK